MCWRLKSALPIVVLALSIQSCTPKGGSEGINNQTSVACHPDSLLLLTKKQWAITNISLEKTKLIIYVQSDRIINPLNVYNKQWLIFHNSDINLDSTYLYSDSSKRKQRLIGDNSIVLLFDEDSTWFKNFDTTAAENGILKGLLPIHKLIDGGVIFGKGSQKLYGVFSIGNSKNTMYSTFFEKYPSECILKYDSVIVRSTFDFREYQELIFRNDTLYQVNFRASKLSERSSGMLNNYLIKYSDKRAFAK